MSALAAALLLAAAAAPEHPAALVGRYDGGQREIAARLELRADGHFRYALSYGALDEQAEGRWEARAGGRIVALTTEPAVKPPAFVVVADEPDITGGITIAITDPAIMQGTLPRVLLFYEPGDAPIETDVDRDGHLNMPDSRRPSALMPELPVYPLPPVPTPLTGKSGHRLVFRLDANDMGRADFRRERLFVRGRDLELERYGVRLVFRR